MIVEDSRVVTEFLRHIINRDPRLEVIECVPSGEDALKALARMKPDVVSLDIRLPGMNGLEATKRIMAEYPVPIVVVSSNVEDEEMQISMNALRAGALAVVQKPVGLSHRDYDLLAEGLCTKLVIMSQVRVIRQRYRTSDIPEAQPALSPLGTIRPGVSVSSGTKPVILGLVASTGGPSALVKVLTELSPDFVSPILVVQHITPGFVHGLVQWLDEVVPRFTVVEARHGETLQPNTIYIAGSERHMVCAPGGTIHLIEGEPVSSQKPSGTVLFQSMSRVYGRAAVGVLMTGMGDDGALGLTEMRQAGATTIAEHESTAVVYGMPAVAVRMGGASDILPLPEIAPRLNSLFRGPLSAS